MARPAGDDVLESERAPALTSRRRLVRGLLVALVVGLLVAAGVQSLRQWVAERSADDVIAVTAQLDVESSSAAPPRGRVDYFAVLGNTGPRAVVVTSVRLDSQGLRVRTLNGAEARIDPGGVRRLRLSVVLDCTVGAPAVGAPLRGAVTASPRSGRTREVTVPVGDATVLTGMAETLCRLEPDLRSGELSGPV